MITVRRLLYREVIGAVVFITLAFLSLFFFIDFLEELGDVGKTGFHVGVAALSALAQLPQRLYEVLPITVLIGTIYALARLAQSSEFTILRTSGLGPSRALRLLMLLGLAMGVATFLAGEYLAPWGEQASAAIRQRISAQGPAAPQGKWVWLRESSFSGDAAPARATLPDGVRQRVIGVGGGMDKSGALADVRFFDFDSQGHLIRRIDAQRAELSGNDSARHWALRGVTTTIWPPDLQSPIVRTQEATATLATQLSPNLVSAAVAPVDAMNTWQLWQYAQHLEAQGQTSQQYELTLWRRLIYPLTCLVMVALALPFAYLHARSGSTAVKVFGGILLGISFVLLNSVASNLGMLRDWTPWAAAAAPSLLYFAMALGAFYWIARHR